MISCISLWQNIVNCKITEKHTFCLSLLALADNKKNDVHNNRSTQYNDATQLRDSKSTGDSQHCNRVHLCTKQTVIHQGTNQMVWYYSEGCFWVCMWWMVQHICSLNITLSTITTQSALMLNCHQHIMNLWQLAILSKNSQMHKSWFVILYKFAIFISPFKMHTTCKIS